MTLNDLTISPQNINTDILIEDWAWILAEQSRVVLITSLGDLFLQGESGKVYFLDVCGGQINEVSENGQEFEALLSNVEFVTDHFFPNMIAEYRENNLALTENTCYSHKVSLVLGGEDKVENIEVSDIHVHVSIQGQIHRQVKDLPPGTKIDEINIQ